MRTDDGSINHRCLIGEPDAFGILVDKYKAGIYALAYSKLRNFHDAEDMTQEVFIKAYEGLHRLKLYDSFHAWLFAITANLCKNWIRHQSKKADGEFIEDKDSRTLENHSVVSYNEKHAFRTYQKD